MISSENSKVPIREDDVLRIEKTFQERGIEKIQIKTHLKVINNAFSIQEVVGYNKEVPIQRLTPRIFALRSTIFGLRSAKGEESRDFLVHKCLAHHYEDTHVCMAPHETYYPAREEMV